MRRMRRRFIGEGVDFKAAGTVKAWREMVSRPSPWSASSNQSDNQIAKAEEVKRTATNSYFPTISKSAMKTNRNRIQNHAGMRGFRSLPPEIRWMWRDSDGAPDGAPWGAGLPVWVSLRRAGTFALSYDHSIAISAIILAISRAADGPSSARHSWASSKAKTSGGSNGR